MCRRPLLLVGLLSAIFAVSSAVPAVAQQPPDPVVTQLDVRISRFLEQVNVGSAENIKAAYTSLLANGQLAKQKEELDGLIAKTEKISVLYGDYRAIERVYSKRVGSDLVFLKYLYKCSKFPVLWHVTFYRTSSDAERSSDTTGTWQVVAIRFDTDLEVLTLLKD